MKHIMTRDEAVVAAYLLGDLTQRSNDKVSRAYRNMHAAQRIAAADRLQKALTDMLEQTFVNYFTVEAK